MQDSYHIKKDSGEIAVMAFLSPDINMRSENRWILNRIAVARGTNTGAGWGTKLLELITTQAEAEKVTLLLGVDPDDPQKFWPLVKWYRRYGFTSAKSRMSRVQNVMIRRPQ